MAFNVEVCLQYRQNVRAQDTWFLLLISAMVAYLRIVGDVIVFERISSTTRYGKVVKFA